MERKSVFVLGPFDAACHMRPTLERGKMTDSLGGVLCVSLCVCLFYMLVVSRHFPDVTLAKMKVPIARAVDRRKNKCTCISKCSLVQPLSAPASLLARMDRGRVQAFLLLSPPAILVREIFPYRVRRLFIVFPLIRSGF